MCSINVPHEGQYSRSKFSSFDGGLTLLTPIYAIVDVGGVDTEVEGWRFGCDRDVRFLERARTGSEPGPVFENRVCNRFNLFGLLIEKNVGEDIL